MLRLGLRDLTISYRKNVGYFWSELKVVNETIGYIAGISDSITILVVDKAVMESETGADTKS